MSEQQNLDSIRFPIRKLAEQTRVGTSTLRAWERRYGLLKPQRTPKGHRLYTQNDTAKVLKILQLLDDGHSLPNIADILSSNESAQELTNIETLQSASNEQTLLEEKFHSQSIPSIWDQFIENTLKAVEDFSIERIDAIYNEASSLYPLDLVTERLIQPCLQMLGQAWKKFPERGIAEEHFYTAWLKNRLAARFHHAYSQARGSRIICACLPGSYHEIGLMLFALSALYRGYRVLYFGADLPISQLPYITQRSAAKGVILGAHMEMQSHNMVELSQLIPKLRVPVFIGGCNQLLDTQMIENAGGVLLGSQSSVALRVLETHVPLYVSNQ